MKNLKLLLSIVFISSLVVFSSAMAASWTAPLLPFPLGSPNAPLDQGSTGQSKDAGLSLKSLDFVNSFIPITLPSGLGIFSGTNFLKIEKTNGYAEISATGLLLPRQASAPASPSAGTIYYSSSTKNVQLYDGTSWKTVGSGEGGTSQWQDVTGGIVFFPSSQTVTDPTHNIPPGTIEYPILGDPSNSYAQGTANRYCSERFGSSSGIINSTRAHNSSYAYYTGSSWTGSGASRVVTSITCTSAGGVGIGVNSPNPSYKLDIAGIVNATGYYLNGSPFTTSQWTNITGGVAYAGGNVAIGTNDHEDFRLNVNGPVKFASNSYVYLGTDSKTIDWNNNDLSISNSDRDININADRNVNVNNLCLSGTCRTTWPAASANYWTLSGNNLNTIAFVKNIYLGDATGETFMPGGATLDNGLLVRSGNLFVESFSGDNAEVRIQSTSGTSNHWAIYNDRATDQLRFWGGDNRLVITKSGNVGIGTSDPGAKLAVRGNISLLREPGVGIQPGPGPAITLESPSSNVSVSSIGAPVQCTKSGSTCGGKSDDTGTTLEAAKLNCTGLTVGQEYTDIYGFTTTGGGVTYQYQTIMCKAGTSQYSVRTSDGTLELLNNGNEVKFSINQAGTVAVMNVTTLNAGTFSATSATLTGNLTAGSLTAGGLSLSGAAAVGGNFSVGGTTNLKSSPTVNGNTTLSLIGGGGCGNYSERGTCYSFGVGSLDEGQLDEGRCSAGTIRYLTKGGSGAQFVFLCLL